LGNVRSPLLPPQDAVRRVAAAMALIAVSRPSRERALDSSSP